MENGEGDTAGRFVAPLTVKEGSETREKAIVFLRDTEKHAAQTVYFSVYPRSGED